MSRNLGPLVALLMLLAVGVGALGVHTSLADHTGSDSNLLRDHVARNIIVGEPIKVCTEYPNATQAAIDLWHTALGNAGYIGTATSLFYVERPTGYDALTRAGKYQRLVADCPRTTTTDHTPANRVNMKISSVLVLSEVGLLGEDHRKPCPAAGCVREWARQVSGPPYYTYLDRALISVGSPEFQSAHENPNADVRGTSRLSQQQFDGLTKVIAHEFGHILGFDHTRTGERGLMDLIVGRHSVITDVDLGYYEASYKPEAVHLLIPHLDFVEPGAAGTIRVHFDAFHVHVEDTFEVRRSDGDSWLGTVATFDESHLAPMLGRYASPPNLDIRERPGAYYYSIFSTTHAYVASEASSPRSQTIHVADTRVTCWDGSKAATQADCPADTRVTCWDGSKAATEADCPADTRVTCWDGSKAATEADCPADTRVTCWDGSKAATEADCPADTRVTCWDGSKAATEADCPADTRVTCWDGSKAATEADCPADTRVTCWDGSKAATEADCPADTRVTCWDGSKAATEADCPADTRVTCWDGSKAATEADCPVDTRVTCWDGSKAATLADCPEDTRVTCWDGSKAPTEADCPARVCTPACGDCYTCSDGSCQFDCPSGQTCSGGSCVKLCFDDQFNQVPCPPPDPCEIPHHPLCASGREPPPPPPEEGSPSARLHGVPRGPRARHGAGRRPQEALSRARLADGRPTGAPRHHGTCAYSSKQTRRSTAAGSSRLTEL